MVELLLITSCKCDQIKFPYYCLVAQWKRGMVDSQSSIIKSTNIAVLSVIHLKNQKCTLLHLNQNIDYIFFWPAWNQECDVCLVIFELLDFSVSVVQFPASPTVYTHMSGVIGSAPSSTDTSSVPGGLCHRRKRMINIPVKLDFQSWS